MKTQNEHWLKKSYQKVTLETKILVVDQILNGQISNNQASKKYDIPRTMYKNNSRVGSEIRGVSPLQLSCNLTGKCHAIGYYSYTNRYS